MRPIIKLYLESIINKEITLDEVPNKLKSEIKLELNKVYKND